MSEAPDPELINRYLTNVMPHMKSVKKRLRSHPMLAVNTRNKPYVSTKGSDSCEVDPPCQSAPSHEREFGLQSQYQSLDLEI